jgi:hypothetical protein
MQCAAHDVPQPLLSGPPVHVRFEDCPYHSPRDAGEAADFGYIGRLPRPDGKGTFLYLARTHAQGTLGAAHYVANNLVELHKEIKNRRFSTVIKWAYDPKDQRKILSSERVSPLYREGA